MSNRLRIEGEPATAADFIRWTVEHGAQTWANREIRAFYVDGDPRHILRACAELRRHGIALPDDWQRAEAWARARPRGVGRGRRAAGARILDVLDQAALLSGERGIPAKVSGQVERAIARNTGLSVTHVRKLLSKYRRRYGTHAQYPRWLAPQAGRGPRIR